MAYKIRPMRRADVDQVVEIDKEAFPTQWPPTNYRNELQNHLAHYVVVYIEGEPTIQKPPATGFLATLRKWFSGEHSLHEVVNEEYIVGFAGCWIMSDENHITEIAVSESYKCQGIGQLMMITLIELGIELGANLTTLEVRVSNTSAQNLYQKLGFETVGMRKRYYTDNHEDALIMTNNNIKSPEFQIKIAGLKSDLKQKWGVSAFPILER